MYREEIRKFLLRDCACLSIYFFFSLLNIVCGQKHPRIWIVLNIVILNSTFKGKYFLKCWITGLVSILQRKSCAVPWNPGFFHHLLSWNVVFQMKYQWFYTRTQNTAKCASLRVGFGAFSLMGLRVLALVLSESAKTNLLTKPGWNCALLCYKWPKQPFLWQLWCFCADSIIKWFLWMMHEAEVWKEIRRSSCWEVLS